MAEEEHVCEFAMGETLVGLGVADTTVGRPLARRNAKFRLSNGKQYQGRGEPSAASQHEHPVVPVGLAGNRVAAQEGAHIP